MMVLAEAGASLHESTLIHDFGIVVAGAGIAVFVFSRLKLPVIFGYLLTGLLLGPHLLPVSLVKDLGTVQELSELGIIFLLFFIGLEFDLKRLQAVMAPALLALILQTTAMLYLAQAVAPLVGWDTTSALFFGSLLAISSSMVTVRVLKDQGRLHMPHAQLAIGVLILEDILAVVLLVILSGVALNREFAWDAAGLVIFLMGVFVVMTFAAGRLLVPAILNRLDDQSSGPEATTLVSLGLVLGISVLALRFNFAPALGAFLAGAILSQTRMAARVEHLTQSLHDLFNAVFFVTIGMLLEPQLMFTQLPWILGLTVLVILFKVGSCWLGFFLAGQPARSSFRGAIVKSQIGEFSFIIAALGAEFGVTGPTVSAMAYGVALLTILSTPLLTRVSDPLYDGLDRMMPRSLKTFGDFYSGLYDSVFSVVQRSMALKLLRRPIVQVVIYFFLVCGVLVAAHVVSLYFFTQGGSGWTWLLGLVGVWVGAAFLMSPFLIAIVRNLNAMAYLLAEAVFAGRNFRPIMLGRLQTILSSFLTLLVLFPIGTVFVAASAPFVTAAWALAFMSVLLVIVTGVFWRRMIRLNSRLEHLFLETFNEAIQDAAEHRRKALLAAVREHYPWEAHLQEVTLPAHARFAGKRIREVNLRQATGSSILALTRDTFQVFDPGPETSLFPGDRLLLLGSEASNTAAGALLEEPDPEPRAAGVSSSIRFENVVVEPHTFLDGQTLAGGQLRQRFGVNVVGIRRGEEDITSPGPDFLIRPGDILYVVGQASAFAALQEACNTEVEDPEAPLVEA